VLPWLRRGIDLLYPRNCQLCGTPQCESDVGVLCHGCRERVPGIAPPFCERCALPFDGVVTGTFRCGYCRDLEFHFERAVAGCRAKGVARDCIHRFKYDRALYFGQHLVEWIVNAGRQWIVWEAVDVIVPVPLHPRKKRHRQFNQAEYLAEGVGQAFGKPVACRAVRRVRDTTTQTRLDAAARRDNLRRAFAVREMDAVQGRRVVLVDDVFTTGATLDACARVLNEAGAANVVVLTVARGV
jgi:ComF family protein